MPWQWWVPSVRTEVVATARVAAPADWLTVRTESKVIERSPDWPAWKLE